jgi:ABC-type transport system substrate-binding protein
MVFRRRSPSPGLFDTVRYLVIDDLSTQWLMFLKGEIDFLGEISKDNWDVVMGKDGNLDPSLAAQGVKLYSIPTLEVFYMGINMRDPVLGGNRKLRQALNAAFDYPRWEEYFSKRTVQADGPVPPGVDGKLSAPFKYAFDLDLAKRLMKEAGYADGIDPKTGRRLVLTLSFGRASTGSREMGELLASFYEKIGVKLELSFHTWDAFLKAVNEGRVQIYNMGWVGDYPDAENFLQLFYSKNVSPGPNHSYYVNAEYDREYDAAMSASTAEERNRRWAACQEMIREDCPWIFSHFGKANSLVRPRVGNYVPSDFPYGQEAYFTVAE